MKNYKHYLILYFLLWVLLFEFILPVNNILPKPSIVFISFIALWKDYHLPLNYLSTISVIYISLLAAYYLIHFIIPGLMKPGGTLFNFVLSLKAFADFIPGILIGLLLIYWFPGSELIEFVFAFATAFISMLIKIQSLIPDVPRDYIYSAYSLGIRENQVNRHIIWKAIQPSLIEHIVTLHFYLWSMLIVFEFIKGGYGLGTIFRRALEYKDLSVLFSGFIITGISVFLGSIFIKYIKSKFFHWSIK